MTEELNEVPRTTPDFVTEAAAKLAGLFPEVVADGKINLDTLKTILDIDVEEGPERFGLTWPGKRDAIRAAQTPTTSTLMPDKEESVDWETTQNVFIEGDNLEVLKILQKHYYGQIKMIYIDPPYNTGNDFVYSDDYADSIGSYLARTGQTDEGGSLSTNSESAGRFHSNWLNMLYPRLRLARNLLADSGVIAVHIDEHEYHHLLTLLNEIFGSTNYLGTVVWDKRNPKGDPLKVSQQHEYIVLFARNTRCGNPPKLRRIKPNAPKMLSYAEKLIRKQGKVDEKVRTEYKEWISSKKTELSGGEAAYSRIDDCGRVYQPVSMSWPNKTLAPKEYFVPLIHPTTGKECPVPERGWRNPPDTMQKLLSQDLILFGKDETTQPRRKYLLVENLDEKLPSVYYFAGSDDALLKDLGISFDNPKPVALAQYFLDSVIENNDVVVDFFAGSGTTAHAIMQLNAKDGGNRRCISVQLPEPTQEKSEARKDGYETISQITRERIRRAGKKVLEGETGKLDGRAEDLDVGFRAYKLVDTNFTKWKADSGLSEDELVGLFSDLADSADDHAHPDALLTEVLLKLGFSLTEKIETVEVAGLSAFSVADGLVMAYLDERTQPTLDQLRELVAREPERLVVLEDAFQGNDELKTNLVQECRTRNVDLWTA